MTRRIQIRKGRDIPISGRPQPVIGPGPETRHVAVVGDDYIGLRPAMAVSVGDRVACGQPLFSDRKNKDILVTAPGSGEVIAINRGPKRKFETLVIRLEGDHQVAFFDPVAEPAEGMTPERLRQVLRRCGMWCAFRTRPFGTVPAADTLPASLFVTAIDTAPLAPDMDLIITREKEAFISGLSLLTQAVDAPLHLCLPPGRSTAAFEIPGVTIWEFEGPHPAGLPSTHIHFIDPVHAHKTVWHIGAQDVIAIGSLFQTGRLQTERVVALGGPAIKRPRHITTRLGASLLEICHGEVQGDDVRIISGSPLDGRRAGPVTGFLGRYHQIVSALNEGHCRGFFSWLMPGGDRFSTTSLFLSSLLKKKSFPMTTAAWGGKRAIYPLGLYEKVMPLDIIATRFLQMLAIGDEERAMELGCLELIEEDLALCSFVCPGKNDFTAMLRGVLTTLMNEGYSAPAQGAGLESGGTSA